MVSDPAEACLTDTTEVDPDVAEEEEKEEEEKEEKESPPQNISRLNSLSGRVSEVTGRTKKLLSGIKDQAIPTKSPTIATKSSLDGIMIDQRLTERTGVLYKAKMIGSLSVQYHKGDKMALDAMRDLKVMAKTSGRHKARIFLRISIQGVHILEDGTMKQIDVHDLDKISYLAEDVDDKKVFAYIYNKQILGKDRKTRTIAHRLFAIKSPKCALIMSNMKAVFHYMHDMRMADNMPNGNNVSIKKAKKKLEDEKKIEEEKEEETAVEENEENLGFDYGKLVNLADAEDLIRPVVQPSTDYEDLGNSKSVLDPGPAINLYSTAPRGNRLELNQEDEADEPVYSTVRKIKGEETAGPSAPPIPTIELTKSEVGTVNPVWNRLDNFSDEDPFSLDRYRVSSSSSESEEEVTFGITPTAENIPSAVFVDDYEWDIGEMRGKKYSEGQIELSESRERLSTVTKKAVASLERARDEQPSPNANSLIDFGTFEDKLETEDPVDLFDSLKAKPVSNNTNANNDLLSIDFTQPTMQPRPTNNGPQNYSLDLQSLLNAPSTSAVQPTTNTMFGNSTNTQTTLNQSNAINTMGQTHSMTSNGAFSQMGTNATASSVNYQPAYTFPVNFSSEPKQNQAPPRSSNPFHQPKEDEPFDPFRDLINDAI